MLNKIFIATRCLRQRSKEMQIKFGKYVKNLPKPEILDKTKKYIISAATKTPKIVGFIGVLSFIIYGYNREPVIVFKRLKSLNKSYKKGDPLPITFIPKVPNKTELDLLHDYYNRFGQESPILVEGNTGIGKTFTFKELAQNHRDKYGGAAYISLKYQKGKKGNVDAIEESMAEQLGVKNMTENREWLEYKRTKNSPNAIWSILNRIDKIKRCRWLGLDKYNNPPLIIIDDIQVLVNPMKADNESWDAIYTALGNIYDLAYTGNAIIIFGSSEASVFKHMLSGNIYIYILFLF